MRRAFTLIELLVVVAIMGLLGTASVGGYRQLQRGMEERGVMQNVNSFIRAAYNRAQIDRQTVEVYFWNETIGVPGEEEYENDVVVGRAIAVRRQGRITRITKGPGGGDLLIDEFGDFEQYDEDGEYAEAPENDTTMRLYQMDGGNAQRYAVVKTVPRTPKKDGTGGVQEDFVTWNPIRDNDDHTETKGTIIQFGYEREGGNGDKWKVGSAYGFEFLSIELPHGYIFGSKYSQNADKPVDGEDKRVYAPDKSPNSIAVYALRPGQSGSLEAKQVASSENPAKKQN